MLKVAFKIGKPDNFYDRIIKFFTKGECYHVELIFSDNTCFSSIPKEGTRFDNIDISDDTKWRVIELPWIDKVDEMIIKAFCCKKLGYKYDWLAVLLGWLFTQIGRDNKYYCCEVVVAVLKPYFRYIQDKWYSPIALEDVLIDETYWQRKFKEIPIHLDN